MSKRYHIMVRVKTPSGWGVWRIHEGWKDRDRRDIRLDKLQNKSGYDPSRFEFKGVES